MRSKLLRYVLVATMILPPARIQAAGPVDTAARPGSVQSSGASPTGVTPAVPASPYEFVDLATDRGEIEGQSTGARPGKPVVSLPDPLAGGGYILGPALASEVEPNGTSATATPIVSPGVVAGNVYPNGDLDYFSFTAAAGDRVYAAVMTSFSANASSDSQLELLDSDGTTRIEFDNDNGSIGGLSSSIAGATIATGGTKYLKVNHNSATNQLRPYRLHFRLQAGAPTPETEPNDTPATANPLPAAGWVSGTRDPALATEQDWYSMTLAAGDTVFLSLDVDPERDGVFWNGRLGIGLFGDANNQILVVDDAGAAETPPPTIPSEALFFTVKNAGAYFAFVDSASAAVGGPTATYHLSVTVFPEASEGINCTTYVSTDVPKTIGPGAGIVSSTITVPGSPRIADLDVSVTLNHALMADIDAHLRSPQGNDNGIFTDIGATAVGGQIQMDLTLDDEAAMPPLFTVLRPVTFTPELAYRLSWFDGENAGGTWTLDLRDDLTNTSGGTLTAWSLRICEPTPPPTCTPGTSYPQTVFTTDFEAGAAGFTHTGTLDEWELGLPTFVPITTCASGTNCYKTDLDNTYDASSNQDLLSPPISLAGLVAPIRVRWAQIFQMENTSFDHFTVDVREVGNPTNSRRLYEWLDATMTDTVGSPAVTIQESSGWSVLSRDISGFAGLNVELVFHVDTDTSVQLAGVGIDDVSVTACVPCPAITLSPATLPNGTIGAAYGQTITASGGTAPYTFGVTAGTLPPGLTLAPTGDLTGTPTVTGTYNFTVTATDANACTGSQAYTIVVACPTITLSPATLPNGTVGVAYGQTITASGGTAPYTFGVTAGTLPTGLTLAPTGALTGTPTTPGTYNFTVTATDATTCTGSQAYTIVVGCPTITVSPATLPGGTVGVLYSQTITASGGTAPYTFGVTAGTLPPGLTLAPTGDLTGTPTASGTYNFTVTATDAGGCTGSQAYTVTIVPPAGACIPTVTTFTNSTVTPLTDNGVTTSTIVVSGMGPYLFDANALTTITHLASGDVDMTLMSPTGTVVTLTTDNGGTLDNVYNGTAWDDDGDPDGQVPYASNQNLTTDHTYANLVTATPLAPEENFAAFLGEDPNGTWTLTISDDAAGNVGTLQNWSLTLGTFPLAPTTATASVTNNTPVPIPSGPAVVSSTVVVSGAGSSLIDVNLTTFITHTFAGDLDVTLQSPAGTIVTLTTDNGSSSDNVFDGTVWDDDADPDGQVPYTSNQNLTTDHTYTNLVTATPLAPEENFGAFAGEDPNGTWTLTISDDAGGDSGSLNQWTLGVTTASCAICSIITVAPATLPGGTAGTAYSQTLTAFGGTGPYTFAVTAGSLPSGLSLSSGGVLSGTPTAPGTSNFTVTATDAGGCTGSRDYTLVIACPAITLAPATLPNGTQGTAYGQTITASGGTAPYTFAVTAGTLPPGLSLATTGDLTGTPTTPGTSNFTVTATDGNGCTGSLAYTLTIDCPVITLAPATLPGGTTGVAYGQTITASGGTAPYTFAVTAGTLPPGLSLATTGDLTGTPTTPGTFNFTVTATDANGCTGSLAYSLVIACPAITLAPATLPNGTQGAAYGQTITASGGTAPYTFAVTAGALPAGLSLATTGDLTGTPTTPGTSSFTVTATDGNGCTGSLAYTLTIDCPTITLAPATLPGGTTGAAYSQTITASGGTAPYTFAVTAGTLPNGLTLSSGGVLSGTPTAAGTFNFTVTATDASACTGTRSYAVTISCATIVLSPATLANGVEGIAYSQTVVATGGRSPYTYAVTSGTLPAGLNLNGATGVLSGTPTAAATSTFVITARDANACTGSQSYAITIAPAADVILGEGLGSNGVNTNRVRVYKRDNTAATVDFQAYGAANWGTNVTSANINGGAYGEIVTGPGPGDVYGPHVRAFDRNGAPIAKVNFFAYNTLKFGVNVAAGDLDGDGLGEILTGAGPGEVFGPHVRGWNFDNTSVTAIAKISFFAYGTLKFGVNVEEGNVDGDNWAEMLTGPGPSASFNTNVRGWNFDNASVTQMGKINFVAHGPAVYGVNVAGGDVDGDGFAEIATTPGPDPVNASTFLGWQFDNIAISPAAGFSVTPWTNTLYGGRVNLADIDSDNRWDLLAGRGRDPNADSEALRYAYTGAALVLNGTVTPFGAAGYGFGVNVAGGTLGHY